MLKKFYEEYDELIAFIIGSRFERDGIEFFTPGNFSEQVGICVTRNAQSFRPHAPSSCSKGPHNARGPLFHLLS